MICAIVSAVMVGALLFGLYLAWGPWGVVGGIAGIALLWGAATIGIETEGE